MNTKLDRTDYAILIIFYAISSTLNIFDYLDQNAKIIEYLIDIPTFIISSYLGILFFMYYLIPNFLVTTKKDHQKILFSNSFLLSNFINKYKRYILFAILGLLSIASIGIIERVVGFWTGGQDWSKFPIINDLLLYSTFNGADSVGLPLAILVTKKFYESQKVISEVQKQQKENELKLLRSQIDPHFLFNNLNTLDSLIDSDSEKAKEYINRLSLIYRYLIQTKDSEVMELAAELEHAENYIFLIKTRFENDYEFTMEKKASLENKFIPTGAIQALLENVVKHNKVKNGMTIKAKVLVEESALTVRNEKSSFLSQNESLGTGLENLKARYQLLSNKKVLITDSETAFVVTIPIIRLSE